MFPILFTAQTDTETITRSSKKDGTTSQKKKKFNIKYNL